MFNVDENLSVRQESKVWKTKVNRHSWHWPRYSLKTALLALTLFAVLCGWVTSDIAHVRQQRHAAEMIERLGGSVEWESNATLYPRIFSDFMRSAVEPRFGETVVATQFSTTTTPTQYTFDPVQAACVQLSQLKSLPNIRRLSLEGPAINNHSIEPFATLGGLRELALWNTKVTALGIAKLSRLPIETLDLEDSKLVDDPAIDVLNRMSSLEFVNVDSTSIFLASKARLRAMRLVTAGFLDKLELVERRKNAHAVELVRLELARHDRGEDRSTVLRDLYLKISVTADLEASTRADLLTLLRPYERNNNVVAPP